MAELTNTGIETHPSGTVGANDIINGNWERIEEILDPALSNSDDAYELIWRAVVRNATDPSAIGSRLEWDASNSRPYFRPGFATVTYAATAALVLADGIIQEVDLTGDFEITGITGAGAGAEITLIIRSDASIRNFTFPGDWVWAGAAEPASIAASKTAVLKLKCTGAAATDVVAEYTVEA